MVAQADHLDPRLVAVGEFAQRREYPLFGSRSRQSQALGAADLLRHRAVDQLIGGCESENVEHVPLAGLVWADMAVTKAAMVIAMGVVDDCSALRHEVTPVSGIAVTRCFVW